MLKKQLANDGHGPYGQARIGKLQPRPVSLVQFVRHVRGVPMIDEIPDFFIVLWQCVKPVGLTILEPTVETAAE